MDETRKLVVKIRSAATIKQAEEIILEHFARKAIKGAIKKLLKEMEDASGTTEGS